MWRNLHTLGQDLLEVLAAQLGLEPRFFSRMFDDNVFHRSTWRYNHYPACPRPDLTLGTGPHSDPNLFTLLKQDAVGGLQVKKDDKWVDVTPVPGALIINVGDALEVIAPPPQSSPPPCLFAQSPSHTFACFGLEARD